MKILLAILLLVVTTGVASAETIYTSYSPCTQPGLQAPQVSYPTVAVMIEQCVNVDTGEVTSNWTNMYGYEYAGYKPPIKITAWSKNYYRNYLGYALPSYIFLGEDMAAMLTEYIPLIETEWKAAATASEIAEYRTLLDYSQANRIVAQSIQFSGKASFRAYLEAQSDLCLRLSAESRSPKVQVWYRAMAIKFAAWAASI